MAKTMQSLLEHPEFTEGTIWHREVFDANQIVIKEGDNSQDIYLVLSGALSVVGNVELEDTRKVRPGVSEMGAGDVFGELALFDEQPRSASVMTISNTELAVINGELFMQFLDTHPDIGYPIMRIFMQAAVGRLRATNRKLFSVFAWGLKAHKIDEHL